MCGRFTLAVDPADLQAAFPGFSLPAAFAPRFNISPTQPVLALANDGLQKADFFVWGLIPFWAKDPAIGSRMINARSETLAEKPSFKAAYKYRRCLIPVDGFYEWQKVQGSKSKIPHYIFLRSRQPFAFAGLWEHWQSADGSEIKSCTIITTTPNELMTPLHNRMPVILAPDDYAQWLGTEPRPAAEMQALLKPFPADQMDTYPVSTLVNNPRNDRPECVVPA